ncbi:hypothetical protein ABZ707_17650 [Streptomyces sp. NPDC006923]|uniref:hypothetical protein n=1 Tax=Streptomyces sp. NPDC006923 TaxID=3155355 RepID=UPI0033FAADED
MAATALARRPRAGRSDRWGTGIALAALASLTVAGCGSPDEAGEAAPPTRQISKSPSAGPSAQKPPPSAQKPPPSARKPSAAPPSAKPSVSAADGRNVGACADGTCEIAVSEPVTFRFKGPAGPATLSVTEVGPNKVEYTVKSGNGRSEGGATGPGQGCITVLRSNGSSNSCGGLGDAARPSPQPRAVVIQAATGAEGTAILHIVSD